MVKTTFIFFFFQLIVTSSGLAEEHRFFSEGTIRARALAMGGAYHSMEDNFSAGFYNPGAFKLNVTKNERRFRLFFNPALTAVALYDLSKYDRDYDKDNKLTVSEVLLSAALFFKGMVFTTPVVDIGLGLGEEIIDFEGQNVSGRMFSVEGLSKGSFHSAFFNVKIAPPVSLGITGTLFGSNVGGKDNFSGGYTFGVLLKPNPKLNVGIAYNNVPDDFSEARMDIECIEKGSATSGISYYPDEKTVVSMDLRTVNKEDQPTSRQIHTGLERRFGERIALRAGYYRKKDTKHNVFSFGIGILPLWEKISKYSHSTRQDIFSYTLIMEEESFKRRWHVLSLLFRK